MISSIYRQVPAKGFKPKDVVLKYEGPKVEGIKPKPIRETLTVETSKKPKRKRMNNKPKTVKFTKEIKLVARYIFSSWSKAIRECRQEEYFYYPSAIRSDTQPLNKGSVEARVCSWVEQNIDEGQQNWDVVLKKLREGDVFLNKGYGNLPAPSLSWLFSFYRNGDWNVNRVLSNDLQFKGKYIQRQVEGGV